MQKITFAELIWQDLYDTYFTSSGGNDGVGVGFVLSLLSWFYPFYLFQFRDFWFVWGNFFLFILSGTD
tara:strand:- start:229 stop:432 length:204 start_codon:yes stop_codon:yes gene_type:complete